LSADPLVLALVSETSPRAALAAGFEEEGVPLTIGVAEGTPHALAREAARHALLGLGLGADAERLVLVLAAAPGDPYLEEAANNARSFAQNAARVAARRPLRYQAPNKR
jgi:cobalamin biosynthesis protein CbiG